MLKLFRLKSGNRLDRKDTFFQYSTEEQFTGEYWIDGKKIYCKVLSTNDWQSGLKNHGITNMETFIDVEGSIYLPYHSSWQPVQRIVPDGVATYSIGIGDISSTQYRVITGSSYQLANCHGYLIFKYTKTS